MEIVLTPAERELILARRAEEYALQHYHKGLSDAYAICASSLPLGVARDTVLTAITSLVNVKPTHD